MTTIDLSKAKKELRAARRDLEMMRGASSFDVYEDAWRSGLAALERCWHAIQHAGKSASPRFSPWLGKYTSFRRTDPLVCYLHHARNSQEHSIRETIEHVPGFIGIGVAPGMIGAPIPEEFRRTLGLPPGTLAYPMPNVYIDGAGKMTIEGDRRGVHIEPSRTELLRVADSGVHYDPPTEHLGFRLAKRDPVTVLDLGVRFYEEVLIDAEQTFSPRGHL